MSPSPLEIHNINQLHILPRDPYKASQSQLLIKLTANSLYIHPTLIIINLADNDTLILREIMILYINISVL